MESSNTMMNLDDNRFEDSHGARQSTDVAENKQAKTKGSSVLDKEERRKMDRNAALPR